MGRSSGTASTGPASRPVRPPDRREQPPAAQRRRAAAAAPALPPDKPVPARSRTSGIRHAGRQRRSPAREHAGRPDGVARGFGEGRTFQPDRDRRDRAARSPNYQAPRRDVRRSARDCARRGHDLGTAEALGRNRRLASTWKEWWAGTGLNRRHQDFQFSSLIASILAFSTTCFSGG